jgi:glycine hydroxymethyltransferase
MERGNLKKFSPKMQVFYVSYSLNNTCLTCKNTILSRFDLTFALPIAIPYCHMTSLLEKYLSTTTDRRSEVIAYIAALDHLQKVAPRIYQSIVQELKDQRSYLKLIASENYSSLTVQLAMGNLLTDKYSEGYPLHRFYAGCENVDSIESYGAELANTLFQTEHAYLQPHSGADANLVAFWAILTEKVQSLELHKLGKEKLDELSDTQFEQLRQALCNQKIMGLSLASGGHLTHGYRHNVSGKMMRSIPYDVDPQTGLLDYDAIRQKALQEKPLILVAGYSAYARAINFAKMRSIADEVGACFMVDMAHFAGLVAGGVFKGDENPVPFAHILTTTTHKTLRGPRGGLILCKKEYAESVNRGCPLILGGPLPHVMAAKAVAFQEALAPSFSTYAHQIVANAKALAAGLIKRGINLLTGGTDNHLIMLDLTKFNITGRQAESVLRQAWITSNRNMIPADPNGPWYTSGIRLGTPALTTLGMKEKEMDVIAETIAMVLSNIQPGATKAKATLEPAILQRAQASIQSLLQQFPLYPELKEF